MALENIEYVREGQLAFITINRPDVRNALNKQTLDEIEEALDRASADTEVGVVIFTGKGDKSFAAGADINQLTEKTALDALQGNGMQDIYNKIESFEKPTIAMINGYALGGGCELAMSCDIRVASTHAKLGLPELNLSIIPGAGGTQRLARLVGKGKALEMILTGKIIDAKEALQCGLITEMASPEDLLDKVREVSEKILSKGPLAVQLAKLSVHMGTETDLKTGLMLEKLSQAVLFNSKDKNEGTKAFLEKRTPVFKGE
ncbi:enoyl-CoA hydratase/isomerase family protein [Halobacillus sp. Nhm2S1]|uniref:enoyl-CoA hydratase/isomerase family protein n=1 Tax=Halobacillus sp. Nhm2S1 TaxID=2866716 RepID=UPI001C73BF64|nr:enoyl-CoA hydratase-related protein [Halobacillus sp. Nhm2S1]MBX0357613.1 enoyl-CoA hydratase/isomerase family protein [Halobacillus sp. Nhm2S1]